MNLTEPYRARTLAFVTPPSDGPASEWRGYALRITVLAAGFGIYVLFRRKVASGGRCSLLGGSRETTTASESDSNAEIKEISLPDSDDRSAVTYNGEVCPICLGAPKIGVKAPCGHLLCADCLASYCDVRIAPAAAPPPCPLCRAPLNSVALACDFAILSPETVDPSAIVIRDWIREYNNHHGLMTSAGHAYLTTRLIFLLNILTLLLLVWLIAARLQVLSWEY